MKRTWLLLIFAALLASPLAGFTLAEAASQKPSHPPKAKSAPAKKTATKDKSAQTRKAATQSRKASTQTRNATARSGQGNAGQRPRVAYNPNTPLRTLQASYDTAWRDSDLDLQSAAALVLDQKTGEALYAKNVEVATPIASITKLMTAMVTLDAGLPLHEEIVINQEDLDRLKGTGSRLALGTRLTREELLLLALMASENRAAAALSRAYPGGRPAFVAAMNRKARAIGMEHAHFVDGTGLSGENRATAADLAKLVDASYRYPLIRQSSTADSYDVAVPGRKVVRVKRNGEVKRVAKSVIHQVAFHNTNSLTRSDDWNIGVSKTGYISEAGRCLVMQASIAERKVIIVLLDSWGKWSRIGDAQRIKKWLEQDRQLAREGSRDSA